jgi:hypothetical protein
MKQLPLMLFASVLAGAAFAATPTSHATVVPPTEKIAGHTQADWSRSWWQWAASFDDADSPIADKTGLHCQLKQSGPVWFLAGTYGTKRTIRSCTVPAGKYLFFPLINYVSFPTYQGSTSCDHTLAHAKQLTDDVSSLILELDGKRTAHLEAHRQATACFDLTGEGVEPSAANGYYIMLRPLEPGTHTLNFGGILPGMSQAVTYTLHVK